MFNNNLLSAIAIVLFGLRPNVISSNAKYFVKHVQECNDVVFAFKCIIEIRKTQAAWLSTSSLVFVFTNQIRNN